MSNSQNSSGSLEPRIQAYLGLLRDGDSNLLVKMTEVGNTRTLVFVDTQGTYDDLVVKYDRSGNPKKVEDGNISRPAGRFEQQLRQLHDLSAHLWS